MPVLECITECERMTACVFQVLRVCVNLRVKGRDEWEWVKSVLHYPACVSKKPVGVKPSSNAINSMMWNGFLRTTGLCKYSARPNLNMTCFFISQKTHCINMEAPNEKVEHSMAFCVFDLQINWPQFPLMRFVSHTLAHFQSQALIAQIGFSCL